MQFVWLFILTIVTCPWDCSSIGDNNVIARRKLWVRAPSIPTNPMIWEFSPFEILSCLSYFYSFATNSILLSHKFAQFILILWGQCVSVNKILFQCWMCVCFVCCIVVWHVILCIIKYTIAKIQIIIGFPLKIYPWSH